MSSEPNRLASALASKSKTQPPETGHQAIVGPLSGPHAMPFVSSNQTSAGGGHASATGNKAFKSGCNVFPGSNRAFVRDMRAIVGGSQASRPGSATPAVPAGVNIKIEPGEIVEDMPPSGSIAPPGSVVPAPGRTAAAVPQFRRPLPSHRPLPLVLGVPSTHGFSTGPRNNKDPLGQPAQAISQLSKPDSTQHPSQAKSYDKPILSPTTALMDYTQSQTPPYDPEYEIRLTRVGDFVVTIHLMDTRIPAVGGFRDERAARRSTAARALVQLGVWPAHMSPLGRPFPPGPRAGPRAHDTFRDARRQSGGAYGREARESSSASRALPTITRGDHDHVVEDAPMRKPSLIDASSKQPPELLEQLQKVMGPVMGRDRSKDSPAAVAAFLEGMAIGARVARSGGQKSRRGRDRAGREARDRGTRSRSPRRSDDSASRRHRARSPHPRRHDRSSSRARASSPAQDRPAALDHYFPRREQPPAPPNHYSPRVRKNQLLAGGHRAPLPPQSQAAAAAGAVRVDSDRSYYAAGTKMSAAEEAEMWLANEAAGYGSGPLKKMWQRSGAPPGIGRPSSGAINEEWPHDLFMKREREFERS
ncbi:hypothetical protein B0H67DRAFT_679427 [Lasiosphaeris hirsuta]|uniref:Uncharacterized protein n=1 Tax=Lasiosphaeris hirsuta TaxID=260670 RepID=A0AA40E884_9PEZI|nr:hypothetical protein B0H67DRAFT_679427 [Lasiosphaeris hirsuta]